MKSYPAENVRNVALVGNSGVGKTALTEAALLVTKQITRMGQTEAGNTASDFDPEEIRRGSSITTSIIPIEWEGHKYNLLDTPGYVDFVGEMIGALHAVEAAILVVDSVAGVEVGTELAWRHLEDQGLPRVVVINHMGRDNASWRDVLEQLESSFDARFVPLQLPIGQGEDFRGIYRLISGSVNLGPEAKSGELPDDVAAQTDERREVLVEAAAESDDELIMKYLEGEELTNDEIRHGLVEGAKAGKYVPVFFTDAGGPIGVQALLDALLYVTPSPVEAPPRTATEVETDEQIELEADADGPLAAQVFKTLADPYVGKMQYVRVFSGVFEADSRLENANRGEEERIGPLYVVRGKEQEPAGQIPAGDIGAVAKLSETQTGDTLSEKGAELRLPTFTYPQPLFSVAIEVKDQGDRAKLGPALGKLTEEDPSLQSHYEEATRELVLSGMGDAHIDVAVRRLADKYGVEVETSVPRVPYRETVSRTGTAEYRHKKQTGGAGQFAEVHLRVEPLKRGEGFEYDSEVFGGAISQTFIPSIQKGIRQVLEHGVIANCPVVDTKAIVFDGKEHPVDSKDIAFQIAGREAFKLAVRDAGPVLLEPVYEVEVMVPSTQMGDVLGDLNTRRAMVEGMEQIGSRARVKAKVPLAEMQRYSTDLRSMTQGRGYYTSEFSHYAQVPRQLAQEIMAATAREAEEED